MKPRILTALVLLPVFIVSILFLSAKIFAALSALLIGWCAWEWSALIKLHGSMERLGYTVLLMLSLNLVHWLPKLFGLLLAVVCWVWASLAVLSYAKGKAALGFEHRWVKGLLGFLLLIPFWMAMNLLRLTSAGPSLLLFVFVLVWAVDSGAYFVGRAWGKRKLIPRVSPKKTWAGLFGGLFACVLVALAYACFQPFHWLQILGLLLFSLMTGLVSVMGDLFESMLKRQAEVKDSGSLLPGHGGLLDRLDSAIPALPIFALGWIFMAWH